MARHSSSGDSRLELRLLPKNVVHAVLVKVDGSTSTVLKDVALTGLSYKVGTTLRMRFTVSGIGTTPTMTASSRQCRA